ncbi:hypothetical protein HQ544_02205 [Candidatus Falkowbacteria bacterium]|nr:hypothetical protein [Candidatus Falkowbacteria bacterium]
MSVFIFTIKYLAVDILLDFLLFPLWWYSHGLIKASQRFVRHLRYGLQITGLKIWLLNMFNPMFGEISWQGRLISFFMRLIFLIVKIISFILWFIFSLVVFLLWLALPLLIIYMVFQQLS